MSEDNRVTIFRKTHKDGKTDVLLALISAPGKFAAEAGAKLQEMLRLLSEAAKGR